MPERAAATVTEFLSRLSPDRRAEITRVRDLIRANLPAGYEEVVSKNMLVYQVPPATYSDTYNRQPLWFVALASEKSYLSLHLMSVYGDRAQAEQLKEGFRKAGKKLDMGKACIRFKTADDLSHQTIATLVASMPLERWVSIAKAARSRGASRERHSRQSR
jgi:hypothetical protein